MQKVDRSNYKGINPDDLATGIGTAFVITEQFLPGLIDIANHIAEAFKNGPRIKRIRALEEADKIKTQALVEIDRRLDALENKPA